MRYDFMIVDVFTNVAFGGNQLAVLTDARGLTSEAMQTITREFDFPETTFLLPPSDPAYARRVRHLHAGARASLRRPSDGRDRLRFGDVRRVSARPSGAGRRRRAGPGRGRTERECIFGQVPARARAGGSGQRALGRRHGSGAVDRARRRARGVRRGAWRQLHFLSSSAAAKRSIARSSISRRGNAHSPSIGAARSICLRVTWPTGRRFIRACSGRPSGLPRIRRPGAPRRRSSARRRNASGA